MAGLTREELIAQGCTEKRTQQGTAYFENAICEVVAKVCTNCREVIALTGFTKHKSGLYGHRATCKVCSRKIDRQYREANPEKARECVRKCYEANSEKYRETTRQYREANPEKVRGYHRKYREDNKEKRRESDRKWQASNPEKCAIRQQRRRARRAALPDTLTLEQQLEIVSYFNGGCALTGSTNFHMDHVIPINCGHGGTNYANASPLRDDLNMSKSDRNIFEWFSDNRERFGLSQAKFDALIAYLAEVNGMTTKEYRAYVDWCFDNPRSLDELTEEEIA
jgi:hypothetical protein